MEKNIIKSKLKQKSDEVVADKVLLKALQSFTDKGQRKFAKILETNTSAPKRHTKQ